MQGLVKFSPDVLEKKSKIGKVYRRTEGRRTIGDQKSSLEPKVQVSLKNCVLYIFHIFDNYLHCIWMNDIILL